MTPTMVTLNQLSPSNGNWNVIRTGEITDYDSGTYTGKVASLQLYSSLVSSNLYSDTFFNDFSVDFIRILIITAIGYHHMTYLELIH